MGLRPRLICAHAGRRGDHQVSISSSELDLPVAEAVILLDPAYAVHAPVAGYDLGRVLDHFARGEPKHAKAARLLEAQVPHEGARTVVLGVARPGHDFTAAWLVERVTLEDGRLLLRKLERLDVRKIR